VAGNFVELHLARKNRFAVDQHRAGATLTFAAARLRAGKTEAVTKETDELPPVLPVSQALPFTVTVPMVVPAFRRGGALGAPPLSKLHGPTGGRRFP